MPVPWSRHSRLAGVGHRSNGLDVERAHAGRVSDRHLTVSHQQPKLLAIDKQPNHAVMHLGRSGKTDRLAGSTFDPGPQRQRLALDLLGVPLAWSVLVGSEMPSVRAPIIGGIAGDPTGLQQRLQLQERFVCAPASDLRQPLARLVIYRRPHPARRGLLLHLGPQLSALRFLRLLDQHVHLVRRQRVAERLGHRGARRALFFNGCIPVVGLLFSPQAVSRLPLPLRPMSTIGSVSAGAHPFVEESTLQASMRTGGVLALRALLPRCGLPAFDDVVAVTVGTQHGKKYHAALLLKPSAAWHTWG